MSHLIFSIVDFPSIFVFLILTCRVTLFDCKLLVYQKLAKLTFLGIFDAIWSTQNVNVARFARNVEWDFFVIFNQCVAYLSEKYF